MLSRLANRCANGVKRGDSRQVSDRSLVEKKVAPAPVKPLVSRRTVLSKSILPPNVLSAQYAVRGPLVVRAVEIEKALKKGEKFPFSRITYCNVRPKTRDYGVKSMKEEDGR